METTVNVSRQQVQDAIRGLEQGAQYLRDLAEIMAVRGVRHTPTPMEIHEGPGNDPNCARKLYWSEISDDYFRRANEMEDTAFNLATELGNPENYPQEVQG